jgi:D-sedoheptulose 7-phosphate isomerase
VTSGAGGSSGSSWIPSRLRATAALHERLASGEIVSAMEAAGEVMKTTLAQGRSILVFGNGGSAADAQHFAAELVVRYERERPGRSAIALTTDTSVLTAAGNDRGFEQVFARQVEALGRPGDVALAVTTSGQSPNVLRALATANAAGLTTIALTGHDGGEAGRLARWHVHVPERRTALVQEAHRTILHVWCEMIDGHGHEGHEGHAGRTVR